MNWLKNYCLNEKLYCVQLTDDDIVVDEHGFSSPDRLHGSYSLCVYSSSSSLITMTCSSLVVSTLLIRRDMRLPPYKKPITRTNSLCSVSLLIGFSKFLCWKMMQSVGKSRPYLEKWKKTIQQDERRKVTELQIFSKLLIRLLVFLHLKNSS